MKHQALFSSKDKVKNIKVLSAAVLLGPLRVESNCTHKINSGVIFGRKIVRKASHNFLQTRAPHAVEKGA